MIEKNKYSLIFIAIFLFCFGSNASAVEKISISQEVSNRIEQYLKQDIYSFVYDNRIFRISSLAMAISRDGSGSVIGYCTEKKIHCRTNSPYLFQIQKKCERISGQSCKVLIKDEYFVSNKDKLKININNKKNFFVIDTKIQNNKKYQSDFEVQNSRDFESDWTQ